MPSKRERDLERKREARIKARTNDGAYDPWQVDFHKMQRPIVHGADGMDFDGDIAYTKSEIDRARKNDEAPMKQNTHRVQSGIRAITRQSKSY